MKRKPTKAKKKVSTYGECTSCGFKIPKRHLANGLCVQCMYADFLDEEHEATQLGLENAKMHTCISNLWQCVNHTSTKETSLDRMIDDVTRWPREFIRMADYAALNCRYHALQTEHERFKTAYNALRADSEYQRTKRQFSELAMMKTRENVGDLREELVNVKTLGETIRDAVRSIKRARK